MLSITLDPARLVIGLCGQGPAFLRRQELLRGAGALPHMLPAEPDNAALAALDLLWIAGLPEDQATALAGRARALRVLVNLEDRPDWCDFHNPAELRRGDLLLAISTGGRSPALAGLLRDHLAELVGAQWQARLDELATRRAAWRESGAGMADVAASTQAAIRDGGWL